MKNTLPILLFLFALPTNAQIKHFRNGYVNFALSSHQDIAWMNVPDSCTEFRIEKLLLPSLRMLEHDPSYCFTMEYALTLEEFLQKYPERKKEMIKLTSRKRLDWGATFNQPYESLLSGEALIREVYLGKRWLKTQLPGCDFLTVFNPDVPGRSLQTSQIYAKAGIKYNVISRFSPGIYRWFSPDGSSLICKSNGIYCDYARTLAGIQNKEEKKNYIRSIVKSWDSYYEKYKIRKNLFFLHTDDNEEPYNYREIFDELSAEKNMPKFKYTTVSSAMSELISKKSEPIPLFGEWPNLWLYIHNPTHHQAVSMMRNAQRTLVYVEKYASIYGMLTNSFDAYPQDKLNEAWKCAIYPDHGWGGNGGTITDEFFKNKFKQAKESADCMLNKTLKQIAALIDHKQEGIPITVFNPQSWSCTNNVTASLNIYPLNTDFEDIILVDEKGNIIPFQCSPIQSETNDGDIQIVFKADSVPSVGYKSYYLQRKTQDQSKRADVTDIENSYYRVSFVPGGVKSIIDKRLNKELLRTDKFLGGEVFCTRSVGNGAGEFTEIQPITMEGFEKSSDYSPQWNIIETGKIREVRECSSRFKNSTIVQRVIVYNNLPKIDFEIDILGFDGAKSREYRMTMPLNQTESTISYEVPMGVVEIGKNDLSIPAGKVNTYLDYSIPLNQTPLRECQNWIASSDSSFNVMLSSSVGVFGYKDATSDPVCYPVLQPVLLASRRSCHWNGNWYLQQGTHSYRFSLSSSEGDWRNTHQRGTQFAEPLLVISGNTDNSKQKLLTPSYSFFHVDQDNVIISTIKKSEDDNGIIVRLFDIEGKDSNVKLWSFKPLKSSYSTNIIEEENNCMQGEGHTLPMKIGHHAIETYKLIY